MSSASTDTTSSSSGESERIPDLKVLDGMLRCDVCLEYMTKPMMNIKCSHNHCTTCVQFYIRWKQECPTCHVTTVPGDLFFNQKLADIIKIFITIRPKLLYAIHGLPLSALSEGDSAKSRTPDPISVCVKPVRAMSPLNDNYLNQQSSDSPHISQRSQNHVNGYLSESSNRKPASWSIFNPAVSDKNHVDTSTAVQDRWSASTNCDMQVRRFDDSHGGDVLMNGKHCFERLDGTGSESLVTFVRLASPYSTKLECIKLSSKRSNDHVSQTVSSVNVWSGTESKVISTSASHSSLPSASHSVDAVLSVNGTFSLEDYESQAQLTNLTTTQLTTGQMLESQESGQGEPVHCSIISTFSLPIKSELNDIASMLWSNGVDAASHSKVMCPMCFGEVFADQINEHLDQHILAEERQQNLRSNGRKRKQTSKLKCEPGDEVLDKKLITISLPVRGSRKVITERQLLGAHSDVKHELLSPSAFTTSIPVSCHEGLTTTEPNRRYSIFDTLRSADSGSVTRVVTTTASSSFISTKALIATNSATSTSAATS